MIGKLENGREAGEKQTIQFLATSTDENSKTRRLSNNSTAHFISIFFCFPGQKLKPEPTPAPEDSKCFLIF